MRLIDADYLLEYFEQKQIEWVDLDIGTSFAYGIAKQTVEEAETVEAIPIEWINRAEKDKAYQQYDWSEILSIVYRWREEQNDDIPN